MNDVIDVDDRGAADANELRRVELPRQRVHRVANHMVVSAGVQTHELAARLEPRDGINGLQHHSLPGFHRQIPDVIVLLPPHLLEHARHRTWLGGRDGTLYSRQHAIDRAKDALFVQRLEYIVDRLDIERVGRESIVRGKKHTRWRVVAELVEKIEAATARHLNVEEQEVG